MVNASNCRCVSLHMRFTLPAFIATIALPFVAIATPVQAADCYSWQLMTCGQPETRAVLDEQRNVNGYLAPQSNGSLRILGRDRQVRGYIEGGRILGRDRRVRGYVEPQGSLIIEGLPRRYSPTLD